MAIGPTVAATRVVGLAEREAVRLDVGSEERDLERTVGDRSALADQLIQTLLGQRSLSLFVDVESASIVRGLSVDEHSKRHGRTSGTRTHDEIDVARVKAKDDPSIGSVQHARSTPDRPVSQECPLVQSVNRSGRNARCEVPSLRGAEVRLGRLQVRPVGLSLEAIAGDGDEIVGDAVGPGLAQQHTG